MSNKQQSKVRFVRCPKCTKILPEPEHVPLYACGGCGAILQAKNYKGSGKNTVLSSHEQDFLQRNGIKHDSYAGESSGSSRRSNSDHSSPQEERRSSDDFEKSRNSEQNIAASAFDNSSLSKESSLFKDNENGEIDDIKSDKICSNSEPNGGPNFSEDTSLSFKNRENGEIDDSKTDGNCSESEINGSSSNALHTELSEKSGCTGNKENGDRERHIDRFDSKDRGANDRPTSLENEPQKVNGDIFTRDESIDYDDDNDGDNDEEEEKLVRPVKSSKNASLHQDELRNEINVHKVDEKEVEKPGKEKVNGTAPTEDASSLTESPDLTQPASEIPRKHFSSDHEVSKQGKSNKENGYGTDPDDIAEQLESVHISTPSSVEDSKTSYEMGPTKVSEGRAQKNSFDDVEGTLKKNIENLQKSGVQIDRKVLLIEIPETSSKRSPTYDGSVSSFDGSDDKVADVRPSRQARGSSSMVLDEKFKTRMIEEEEGPLKQNEFPRRFRSNTEKYLPWGPNHRSSELTYEMGSTSSYALHDEFPRKQTHSHNLYGRGFREPPLWREKELLPVYYNSESSGEFYDRPKQHTYMDRRRRTESWSQSGTIPRNPYSAEMYNGRYPYMQQRYPEDRRWSAQLPQPAIYFNQEGYMNSGWETRWDPYDSYPNSPHRFMEPDPSWAWPHDTISLSDDPRHKDQIMRELYLREKRESMKTPLHPIAGGTPFITCYFCFHILQLPKNFLLSRKRRRTKSHKLKCGACSRVLEFSLENEGGGLAPYETTLNRDVNFSMSSHSQANHSRHSSVTSVDSRILLSRDSFGASNREKRMSGSISSSKGNQMEERLDDDDYDDDDDAHPARGRRSKVTWKLPARSKSPLHKLMGYSSPRDMLAFHEDDNVE